jgi:hypothetical protein
MIYMTGNDITIIVLETGNLQAMKDGRPAKTPDGKVLIAWTPDPVWLADKLADSGGDGPTIAKLIDEASKRPQKPVNRPYHGYHQKDFREDKK